MDTEYNPFLEKVPCRLEGERSLRCREKHPSEQKACQMDFDAYKDCMKRWYVAPLGESVFANVVIFLKLSFSSC